ncbi:uncharacterized protein B0I36DRAFT_345 [Microdochium trichocladiopsis]|uniref:Zn(2)-C6 fungal-type domain-containing protein n=1 Tax=Microdochium trichocladiopsis TaxID=1682393 RepID=A0A9P8YI07_9PEZI|nr:uncharacterized protein B0I36DRAFT_345 [Microdochium trichocladiopsis]KAH7039601.1 hypothetical protein B0I36DRAFT_345 [Microdochium trichocladiopsis]
MTDYQEQQQPAAVAEVHLCPQGDAAGVPPSPTPLPAIATAHQALEVKTPDASSDVANQLPPLAGPSGDHTFSAIGETTSEVWSADQYIPTDSDLAAALAQTPVTEPAQLAQAPLKSELDVLSPSSALPGGEVTQLLGVLEQGTSENDHAPLSTVGGTAFDDGLNHIPTKTPEAPTITLSDNKTTLDHDRTSVPVTPRIDPSVTTQVDLASEVHQINGVDSSASSPAEMAGYHHPSGDQRSSVPYSASPQHGSPGIHPSNYGFQSNVNPSNHGYPPLSNPARSGGMSLPSMRTFESGTQHVQSSQPQPQRTPAMTMPSLGGTLAGGSIGYTPQPPPLGSTGPYGLHQDRYSLQGDAHSMFAANRHKKEIKRRTKTGCLTCRKRRIKCDETHPTCKNCQKSKRECLGYDPIFKQQQQHPPTNIQPAPNHPAGSSSSTATHNLSTPSASASAATTPYLHYSSSQSAVSHSGIPAGGFGPTSSSHHSSTAPAFANILTFPTRKMRVDELINIEGLAPPALDGPLTAEQVDECRDLYEQVYAPGLESFFEAKWYIMPPGYEALANDSAVNEVMIGFLNTVRNLDPHDSNGMQYSASLEFRVVWDLARLVTRVDSEPHPGADLPAIDDAHEIKNRVNILEVLLSGEFLDQNPLRMPPSDGDYHRIREFRFWYYLGEFLRIKKPETPNMSAQKSHALSMLRELLDGRENRDVLYSLVVIRDLAPKFPADFENSLPPHLDESDPKSKLAVARKFIQDESQVSGGTTNVVRRIAELGVRAFILPGGNIPR